MAFDKHNIIWWKQHSIISCQQWDVNIGLFDIAKLTANGTREKKKLKLRNIRCHSYDSRLKSCKIVMLTTSESIKKIIENKVIGVVFLSIFQSHHSSWQLSWSITTHKNTAKYKRKRECNRWSQSLRTISSWYWTQNVKPIFSLFHSNWHKK